ncbi:hypothetical protein SASPL_146209 [Salvia splendens]|uniref:Uncharacterized protein n=1 Tax=Salvia splendens TaxID=180675 RepID=A0A8X8Z4P1_SALSN|nr:hypothetical protein SASPL_146209 [Salvia splendens]
MTEKTELPPLQQFRAKVDIGHIAARVYKDPTVRSRARKVVGIKRMTGLTDSASFDRHAQMICPLFVKHSLGAKTAKPETRKTTTLKSGPGAEEILSRTPTTLTSRAGMIRRYSSSGGDNEKGENSGDDDESKKPIKGILKCPSTTLNRSGSCRSLTPLSPSPSPLSQKLRRANSKGCNVRFKM